MIIKQHDCHWCLISGIKIKKRDTQYEDIQYNYWWCWVLLYWVSFMLSGTFLLLCRVSLCRVLLCWVSLCWMSLCWMTLRLMSLCWVPVCRVLLCWVSLMLSGIFLIVMSSVIMTSIIMPRWHYDECRNAACQYGECHYDQCWHVVIMLSVDMLSAVMLSYVAPIRKHFALFPLIYSESFVIIYQKRSVHEFDSVSFQKTHVQKCYCKHSFSLIFKIDPGQPYKTFTAQSFTNENHSKVKNRRTYMVITAFIR